MNFRSGFHEVNPGQRTLQGMSLPQPTSHVKTLSLTEWEDFLARLYERDDRLELKRPGETYPPEEQVDAYTLSAHAEAMQSSEVDGDLWGTLEDIEESAKTEAEAWQKIVNFYQERGCILVRVADTDELEEWILSEDLATRLNLL